MASRSNNHRIWGQADIFPDCRVNKFTRNRTICYTDCSYLPRRRPVKKFFLLAIIFALVLGLHSAARAQSAAESAPSSITAAELWRDFENNEKLAAEKHLGQTRTINGTVTGTGMSIYMTPNVMLSDGEKNKTMVICVLPRKDTEKLSDYQTGMEVVMKGRIYRRTERGIVVKECRPGE